MVFTFKNFGLCTYWEDKHIYIYKGILFLFFSLLFYIPINNHHNIINITKHANQSSHVRIYRVDL